MKIVEIDKSIEDKSFDSRSTPLTYRIAIKLDYSEKDLTLTREYFYVGYNDGESVDKFYFDNQVPWARVIGITRATFLTRNFDKDYLKEKEKELIENFYEQLIKSEENYKKELKEKTKELKITIKNYKKYQNDDAFLKIKRKQKLKNIKGEN